MTRIVINPFSVVVLIGAPGSGKTTFARKHFYGSSILSSGHFREMLCDNEWDQTVTREAFNLLKQVFDQRLKNKCLVTVIDATNIKYADRAYYIDKAKRAGAHTVIVVLDPSYVECCINNESRNRRVPEDYILRACNTMKDPDWNPFGEGDIMYRLTSMGAINEAAFAYLGFTEEQLTGSKYGD